MENIQGVEFTKQKVGWCSFQEKETLFTYSLYQYLQENRGDETLLV